MKWIICLLAILWPCVSVFAQSDKPQPMAEGPQIGDEIRDEIWNLPLRVVNHPERNDTITLNDYKGKLVILDFWAKWCSSCIAAFPKLEELNKKFDGEVYILSVGNEEACADIFKKQRIKHNLELTSVISKALFDYFDIYGVPHAVIIDKNGTLIASTYGEYVTAENIQALLKEEHVNFPPKAPGKTIAKNRKALRNKERQLEVDDIPVLFRSVLTPFQPTLNRGVAFTRDKGVRNGVRFFNMSGLALYQQAYSKAFPSFPMNRLILEIRDSTKLLNSMYCYELIVSPDRAADLNNILRREADQLFGYVSKIEKRMARCLALVLIRPADQLKTKGGKPAKHFSDSSYVLQNMKIDELIKSLRFQHRQAADLPIVDATNLPERIDLAINADLKDIEATRKELQKCGLDLREKEVKIEMLVISEKK